MRYQVMIADDEKWVITGLKTMINWEGLGLEVVHTASCGQEALEKFRNDPVDIVVTDINMPQMNGLELLMELKKLNQQARFVILSGYDEFCYAQKAIKIGVEGYVVKPFNEEELEQILREIIVKLDGAYEERIKNHKTHKLLRKLLENQGEAQLNEEIEKAYPHLMDLASYTVAVIKADEQELLDKLCDAMRDYSERYGEENYVELFEKEDDEVVLVTGWREAVSQDEVIAYYEKLQKYIAAQCQLDTFVAVSNSIACLWDIHKAYQIVKELTMYCVIKGFDTVVTEELLQVKKNTESNLDTVELHKLIMEKKQLEAVRYIEDVIMNTIKSGNMTPDYLYSNCIRIVVLLDEMMKDFKIEDESSVCILKNLIEQIYRANNPVGLTQLLIRQIREVIELIRRDDRKYTPVIQQIMTYVDANYQEDMNLKTLACKYNMNASYLGRLFLKEVGCTFAQYLNEAKMIKSKELILNTHMKINDIAKAVGYFDMSYFYRKFKNHYGVSPVTFREMKTY